MKIAKALPLLLPLLSHNVAFADDVSFGAHDIPTLFFISKNTNRNRVDFGVALDEACMPRRKTPVFSYWRNLEEGANKFSSITPLEQRAYGIARQRVMPPGKQGKEAVISFQLRAFPTRNIVLNVKKGAAGCVAQPLTHIDGKRATLERVEAHVSGFMNALVDYVVLHGKTLTGGTSVTERMAKK